MEGSSIFAPRAALMTYLGKVNGFESELRIEESYALSIDPLKGLCTTSLCSCRPESKLLPSTTHPSIATTYSRNEDHIPPSFLQTLVTFFQLLKINRLLNELGAVESIEFALISHLPPEFTNTVKVRRGEEFTQEVLAGCTCCAEDEC